jgi:predicted ribosomally synthesized peptide with SipW-like signal peptide
MPAHSPTRRRRNPQRVLLSLALVGVAGSLAAFGTYASFTSTTSASQSLSTGTVNIALGSAGTATNRLTVNASGLVPGDTVQRAVDLTNSGNQALASIALTTTASPSSLLDTDTTNGLKMVIDSCPTSWTEAGTAPAYSYTCGGTVTSVLTSTPIITPNATLPGLNSLAAGGTDHLRVTLTLPTTAVNTFQGLTSTVSYSFTGTQRPGSSH